MPARNIDIDVNLPEPKETPVWKWLVQHLVVPVLTALIGAGGAGWVIYAQASADQAKSDAKVLVREAALDHIRDESRAAVSEGRPAVLVAAPPPELEDELQMRVPGLGHEYAQQALEVWSETVKNRSDLPRLPPEQMTVREKR